MNNKLILIKKLQQGGGLEISPYLQSFLQMYDQPQQPVNNPVAYSVPVVQTSDPIPEEQREEEHPLSFMDNIQRYSSSNNTKVRPKAFKKKKVYPKQQASVVQSQESKEQESKKQTNEGVEQAEKFTDHSILSRSNRPNKPKIRLFRFYNMVPWEKNYTNSGDQFRDQDEETRYTRDYSKPQSWWMLPFYQDYFTNFIN